jgi:hypothetical protein
VVVVVDAEGTKEGLLEARGLLLAVVEGSRVTKTAVTATTPTIRNTQVNRNR